jgi:protein TonB
MTSVCQRCTLLGFALSALVHLAVAAVLWNHYTAQIDSGHSASEHLVAVDLAMFADPRGSENPTVDETFTGPTTAETGLESEHEPKPEPEPLPKPAPETVSEAETEPVPVPVSDPVPGPAPVSNPAPVLDSKPESKPRPVPEPKLAEKTVPGSRKKPARKKGRKQKSTQVAESPSKPATKTRSQAPRSSADGAGKRKVGAAAAKATSGSGGKKSSASSRALEQSYLAGLRRAIAKKRRYPASARRRSETGVVSVSFVIARNGRIDGVRVDKSSGSRALDKAALDTLRRLKRYKPIPKDIGRTSWRLRVPIRFALE